MSLSEELSSLQENVENIATEGILDKTKEVIGNITRITPLTDAVIERFNSVFQRLELKKLVEGMDLVDFKFATEVFTMIPLEIANPNKAKLTSNSSVINKNTLLNTLEKVDSTPPSVIIDTLNELRTELPFYINKSKELNLVIDEIKVKLIEEINRLNSNVPKVIYQSKVYNLLDSPIREIAFSINDTKISYTKYENKLNKLYIDLYDNEDLRTFVNIAQTGKDANDLSIAELVDEVLRTLDSVSSKVIFLETFLSNVEKITSGTIDLYSENSHLFVYEINSAISFFEKIDEMDKLIRSNSDNFFLKLMEILEILD